MKRTVLTLAMLALPLAAANAEPLRLEGTITDIVGRHLVVNGGDGKVLVDLGPKAIDQSALKTGDRITVDGDFHKGDRLIAATITAPNGQTYVLRKEKEGWLEWLTGNKPTEEQAFTAEQATRIATDKGYALAAAPVAEKKHFTATASKDGKTFEIDIHRDGGVVEKPAFSASEARALVAKEGYEVIADPVADKEHFQMLAKKDGAYYAVDAHRDQSVKEVRKVDKSDIQWGPKIP